MTRPDSPDDAWRPRYAAAAALAASLAAHLPAPAGRAHRAGPGKPGLLAAAWHRGDRTVLIAVDAVGHGGPAAALLAFAVAHVLAGADDPGEALTAANRYLLALDRAEPPFAAAGMVVLAGRTVRSARAGLPPFLHCGDAVVTWTDPGPPLGLMDAVYATAERPVGPGETLLLAAGGPGAGWREIAERHRGCGVRHFVERVHADLTGDGRAGDLILLAAEL